MNSFLLFINFVFNVYDVTNKKDSTFFMLISKQIEMLKIWTIRGLPVLCILNIKKAIYL